MIDWKKEEEEGGRTPDIPAGYHLATIDRILTGKQDGTPFQTSNGDPAIMLIWKDKQGRETADYLPLIPPSEDSKGTAWRVSMILSRIGHELDHFTRKQIDMTHFEDQGFCDKVFVGRSAYILVEYERKGDKTYSRVTPHHESELPGGVPVNTGDRAKPSQNQGQAPEGGGAPAGAVPGTDDDIDIPFAPDIPADAL